MTIDKNLNVKQQVISILRNDLNLYLKLSKEYKNNIEKEELFLEKHPDFKGIIEAKIVSLNSIKDDYDKKVQELNYLISEFKQSK